MRLHKQKVFGLQLLVLVLFDLHVPCIDNRCATFRDLTEQHRRLAEIVEMIHTASLVHDDVLDESSVRRGWSCLLGSTIAHQACHHKIVVPNKAQLLRWSIAEMVIGMVFAGQPTVNRKFGTKVAVLVGDFLFAQSSWFLAQLDNLEVSHNYDSLYLSAATFAPLLASFQSTQHTRCDLRLSASGDQAYQSGHC